MKGISISCASNASTAICTSISMDQPSSSSSFPLTLLAASSGKEGDSPAIDRHNPIIADNRRVSRGPPTSSHPKPPTLKPAQKNTSKKKNTSSGKRLIGLTSMIKTGHENSDLRRRNQAHAPRKSVSKPSDLITISPPESSRYLLGEGGSGFLDRVLSDFDPVLKLKVPCEDLASHELVVLPKSSARSPLTTNFSSSDHQVVVLRVSLHCRGCEGKVRKHISRMQGVKSFNIDFAAKKVTVVGEVTPLQVLASISKVKKAQLWTPPPPSYALDPTPYKF